VTVLLSRLGSLRARLPVDAFLLLILLTVGIAALLPARGGVAGGFSYLTTLAIGVLFFLYGVRLSPREADRRAAALAVARLGARRDLRALPVLAWRRS